MTGDPTKVLIHRLGSLGDTAIMARRIRVVSFESGGSTPMQLSQIKA